jgi:hypothetical protein
VNASESDTNVRRQQPRDVQHQNTKRYLTKVRGLPAWEYHELESQPDLAESQTPRSRIRGRERKDPASTACGNRTYHFTAPSEPALTTKFHIIGRGNISSRPYHRRRPGPTIRSHRSHLVTKTSRQATTKYLTSISKPICLNAMRRVCYKEFS